MSSNPFALPLNRLYPLQNAIGSKRYFTEVEPLKWDFSTYATHTGCKGRTKRLINKSLYAYKSDLEWLLKQDLPSEVKSHVGRLREKADNDDILRQVSDTQTDHPSIQTIQFSQQVDGSTNITIGYQSREAPDHLEDHQSEVADGSHKRKFAHEEETILNTKKSRDRDSRAQNASISEHDLSTSSIESIQTESYAPSTASLENDNVILDRVYVLDFYELYGPDKKAERQKLEVLLTLPERLAVSSIEYVDEKNVEEMRALAAKAYFTPFKDLGANIYSAIRQWRRDMNEDRLYLQPSPNNMDEAMLYSILTYTIGIEFFLRNLNAESSYRHILKHIHWNKTPAEMDFMARHVIALFQSLFSSRSSIQVEWNTLSFAHKMSNDTTNQRRSDMLFTSQDGIEIANGEVKPPETNGALLDVDRARIAELCKRQLHMRIKESKSEKEFVTYGILIAGQHIEVTCMTFQNRNYKYGILKTLTLPTTKTTYTHMEESLEILSGWKDAMIESLGKRAADARYTFEDFEPFLKPTLAFLK
ncbi:hypothetical protein EC973_006536 [Apophysomyces ossiformis]|uniref:Uncharacterized protein n=1 Tax=Apophysomyces ossiformis TaxID=679940 RepID=A0A8H7ELP6_9FUNG|nr:hypothetical protein EC973_006536 [Apophysomyces ossiformis]